MQGFSFPKGMLLGAASAATQIEGGDRNNSWYDWYEKGRIHDGSSLPWRMTTTPAGVRMQI